MRIHCIGCGEQSNEFDPGAGEHIAPVCPGCRRDRGAELAAYIDAERRGQDRSVMMVKVADGLYVDAGSIASIVPCERFDGTWTFSVRVSWRHGLSGDCHFVACTSRREANELAATVARRVRHALTKFTSRRRHGREATVEIVDRSSKSALCGCGAVCEEGRRACKACREMVGYSIEWDDPSLARALGLIRNASRDGHNQGRRHIIDPQSGAMVAAIYEHCESQVLAKITGKGTFILRMPDTTRAAREEAARNLAEIGLLNAEDVRRGRTWREFRTIDEVNARGADAAREECHPAVCVDPQPPSQMKSEDDSAQAPGDERRPCTCPIALLMTGPCRCGGR